MTDRVPETWVLGFEFWKRCVEMSLWQVEQGFSSIFDKILAYLMIFQSFAVPLACSSLKNLAKNEEKPCSTCHKLISPWHFQNPKPKLRVSDPSLVGITC